MKESWGREDHRKCTVPLGMMMLLIAAWSVLSLANQTEMALTLMNTEMSAIRTAVIQHRLALDIILAEKGGICKILNVSCCFYVPDEYENITNITKHMQDAIRPTPVADDSWGRPLQQTKGCERGVPQV
uniref:Uncharacterized protein n=1 Tax=Dicentrarchus labrax TaxID=13489 RepID=A0A8C4GHZ2_DICLA